MAKKAESVTPAQREGLEEFGIRAPEHKSAASSLLTWIRNGGDRGSERVAMIKDTQQRYEGKRVEKDGKVGIVRYVFWQSPASRVQFREKGHTYTHPLSAMVDWKKGPAGNSSIGSLTLVEKAPVLTVPVE